MSAPAPIRIAFAVSLEGDRVALSIRTGTHRTVALLTANEARALVHCLTKAADDLDRAREPAPGTVADNALELGA